MGSVKMIVKVNNAPNYTERYVVARIFEGELWYWGSWANKDEADEAALNVDGVVCDSEVD